MNKRDALTALFKFIIWSCLLSILGFIIGYNPLFWSDDQLQIITATILQTGFILLTIFPLFIDNSDRLVPEKKQFPIIYYILLSMTLISTALMFYSIDLMVSTINHWLCLTMWCTIGIFYNSQNEDTGEYKKMLYALTNVWLLLNIFLLIGEHWLKFSKAPIEQLHGLSKFLELKSISTIIFITSLIFYCAAKVRRDKTIIINNLFKIQEEQVNANSMMSFIKFQISMLLEIINSIFITIGYPLKFMSFVAKEIVLYIKSWIKHSKSYLPHIGTFLFSLLGLYFCIKASIPINEYVKTEDIVIGLSSLGISIALILLLIVFQLGISFWESCEVDSNTLFFNKEVFVPKMYNKLSQSSYLIFAVLFSGLFLFLLSRFGPISTFTAFYNSGFLTIGLMAFVILASFYFLFNKSEHDEKSESSEKDNNEEFKPTKIIKMGYSKRKII